MESLFITETVSAWYRTDRPVVDPMFEREELKDFLNHQRDIREVKWQNGVFDRLVNQAEPSPDQPVLKNVRVWQLKPDVDIRMKFISYEEMCRQFGSPSAEQYQLVYDGAVETNDLEALYTTFNTEWPEGYTGHSPFHERCSGVI